MTLRVCVIGHFSDSLDEGVRLVGKEMAVNLQKNGLTVKKIEITSLSQLLSIRKFKPDIIHFIVTPTEFGIVTCKIISLYYQRAKTVISAIHPDVSNNKLLGIFKPDLILVQSYHSESVFKSIGYNTRVLLNGVDIDRFKPKDMAEKLSLREKYSIPEDRFILLHLASLTRERNLDIFKELQKSDGIQTVIIGRENESYDAGLVKELRDAGCLVLIKHFQHIEDIYNLSDCYLFPTVNKKACIETPLSVLEAMACNLPVISTQFGSLGRVFNQSKGFFWIKDGIQAGSAIDSIRNGCGIETREMVHRYSWDNITKELLKIYSELL